MSLTTHPDSARTRTAGVLFVAQSFFTASSIAAFTLSPIIASALSGSDSSAGVPNTLGIVGRAAFVYPLGYLMDRIGRRYALAGGYGMAILGGALSFWAVLQNNYLAFLLGSLIFGMSRSASDLSRYVAAEVFPLQRRARVIGFMVFAGTAGAIGGPRLVPISTAWMERIGWEGNAGPFAVATVAMLLASLTIVLFLRPDPQILAQEVARQEAALDVNSIENRAGDARSLREIFSAPLIQLAILAMLIGYFVMSFLMVITPLHMNHHDHTTSAISNVIMAHTLGMFGLSWLTGWLIDRFGRIAMIVAGAVVLVAACVAAPLSLQVPILGLALFLLGLGWNFCFVAGSSLLSDALTVQERGRAQGASETIVAVGTGISSLTVGVAFEQGDYALVSLIGLTLSLALIAAVLVLVRRDRALTRLPVGTD